jgi:hypothetical protein
MGGFFVGIYMFIVRCLRLPLENTKLCHRRRTSLKILINLFVLDASVGESSCIYLPCRAREQLGLTFFLKQNFRVDIG